MKSNGVSARFIRRDADGNYYCDEANRNANQYEAYAELDTLGKPVNKNGNTTKECVDKPLKVDRKYLHKGVDMVKGIEIDNNGN